MLAYGQSKTANVLFAVEAASRWASDGITANPVHPGAVIETNLARNLDPDILAAAIETAGYEYKTREQGAATSVLVAASPLLEGITGRYFADCNQAPVVDSTFTGPPRGFGVAPCALDPTPPVAGPGRGSSSRMPRRPSRSSAAGALWQ
jgi:hypothetical protein